MSASTLVLTTATKSQHGSAFNCHPVPSAGLTADFTATIGGGNGADGMTFALLDATKAGDASLGSVGAGLGFSGLPGVAVTLDTYPKVNLIGIATSTAGGTLTYVKTATSPSSLRATNSLRVSVSAAGVITVYINKTQVLTATVKVPPRVLAGFTGATGGLDDIHEVSNVVISL